MPALSHTQAFVPELLEHIVAKAEKCTCNSVGTVASYMDQIFFLGEEGYCLHSFNTHLWINKFLWNLKTLSHALYNARGAVEYLV